MPALTKEERAAKRAAEEASRKEMELAKRTEQLAKNPLRLLKLMARATAGHYADVQVFDGHTDPTKDTGPLLYVKFTMHDLVRDEIDGYRREETLNVFSDDWAYDSVESEFDRLDAEREAERKRVELARATYDSLTPEQRTALGLKYRP